MRKRLNFIARSNAAMHFTVKQSEAGFPPTISQISKSVGVSKRYAHMLMRSWLNSGMVVKATIHGDDGKRAHVHYWVSPEARDNYYGKGYANVCFDAYKMVGNFNIFIKRREIAEMGGIESWL